MRAGSIGCLHSRLSDGHEHHGPRLPNDRQHGDRRLPSKLLLTIPFADPRSAGSAQKTAYLRIRFGARSLFRDSRARAVAFGPCAHQRTGILSPALPSQSRLPDLILS